MIQQQHLHQKRDGTEDFQDEEAAKENHPLKLEANSSHHEPLEIDHMEIIMQQPKGKWKKRSLIIVALLLAVVPVAVGLVGKFKRNKSISLLSPYIPGVPSSPIQQQALDWLLLNDNGLIFADDGDRLLARYALAIFYFSTHGEEWSTKNDKWLSAAPVCDWNGTSFNNDENDIPLCNNTNMTVDQMIVWDKGLKGTIPTEIGLLTALTLLSLAYKNLGGTIPTEIGRLTALKHLTLTLNYAPYTKRDANLLHGTLPTEIGLLSNLKSLLLRGNNIEGTIPSDIKALSSLTYISLEENSLTGTIPPQLASLTLLEKLVLSNNILTGTIPDQLGSLMSLEKIFFDDNHLVGTIPTQFGSLTFLKVLTLTKNTLTGTIPTELGRLTALSWLLLGANALTGTVPTEINSLFSSLSECG